MVEKAKVSIYQPDTQLPDFVQSPPAAPAPPARAKAPVDLEDGGKAAALAERPAFKAAGHETTSVVTSRVQSDLVKQVKAFCKSHRITFASFVEVALADELEKQLGNETKK